MLCVFSEPARQLAGAHTVRFLARLSHGFAHQEGFFESTLKSCQIRLKRRAKFFELLLPCGIDLVERLIAQRRRVRLNLRRARVGCVRVIGARLSNDRERAIMRNAGAIATGSHIGRHFIDDTLARHKSVDERARALRETGSRVARSACFQRRRHTAVKRCVGCVQIFLGRPFAHRSERTTSADGRRSRVRSCAVTRSPRTCRPLVAHASRYPRFLPTRSRR